MAENQIEMQLIKWTAEGMIKGMLMLSTS